MDSLQKIAADKIKKNYKKRTDSDIYSLLNQGMRISRFEILELIGSALKSNFQITDLENIKFIDVGCGDGKFLREMINFGVKPENMIGIELIKQRSIEARSTLPESIKIYNNDFLETELQNNSFDIALQSLVFSSILDHDIQSKIAKKMIRVLKPGGIIIWWDFTYDNPKNKDVLGVPLKNVKLLFPEADFEYKKVTLAPPITRMFNNSRFMLKMLNKLPFLKTHILCIITKRI